MCQKPDFDHYSRFAEQVVTPFVQKLEKSATPENRQPVDSFQPRRFLELALHDFPCLPMTSSWALVFHASCTLFGDRSPKERRRSSNWSMHCRHNRCKTATRRRSLACARRLAGQLVFRGDLERRLRHCAGLPRRHSSFHLPASGAPRKVRRGPSV